MLILVMGVTSCGKSTIGQGIADGLGIPFLDGDHFHPPENIAKMKSGTPLTDADRLPWLKRLRQELEARRSSGGAVVGCSALKQCYRDILLGGFDDGFIVHLTGSPELLKARIEARKGHFMPPTLLASQLATLEPPTPGPRVLALDIAPSPAEQIATALERIRPLQRELQAQQSQQ